MRRKYGSFEFSIGDFHLTVAAISVLCRPNRGITKDSMHSFMCDMGYESRMVTAFSLQCSTQKWSVPPFLGANMMGATHSGWTSSTTSIATSCRFQVFSIPVRGAALVRCLEYFAFICYS